MIQFRDKMKLSAERIPDAMAWTTVHILDPQVGSPFTNGDTIIAGANVGA